MHLEPLRAHCEKSGVAFTFLTVRHHPPPRARPSLSRWCVVWKAVDGASSLSSAVAQLSTAAMIAFNADYPNRPGVAYYSLAGRSALSLATDACKADLLVDFVVAYDKVVDPLDPFFYATREVIDGGFLKAIPHDGLVRVDDARWGTFLGCVPADHLDEIGQIFGDYPGGFNTFDHKKLFRDLVAMLRAQGF